MPRGRGRGARGDGAEHDDAPRGVPLRAGARRGGGRRAGRAGLRVRLEEDEIPPGGSRVVRFHFTPFKPCEAYDAVVACDVDGAAAPVAFELKCEIRGLRVAYDVLRGRGGPVACGDGLDAADAESAVFGDGVGLDFRGPVRGARARDDGGGDSEPDGDGGDGIARVRVPRRRRRARRRESWRRGRTLGPRTPPGWAAAAFLRAATSRWAASPAATVSSPPLWGTAPRRGA